jgi:hypothetical protein
MRGHDDQVRLALRSHAEDLLGGVAGDQAMRHADAGVKRPHALELVAKIFVSSLRGWHEHTLDRDGWERRHHVEYHELSTMIPGQGARKLERVGRALGEVGGVEDRPQG